MSGLNLSSLRSRLLLLLLLAILPAFALMFYLGVSQRRSALRQGEAGAEMLARMVATQAGAPQYFLAGLATLPSVRNQRSFESQELFKALVGLNPTVIRLSVTGLDGRRYASSATTPHLVDDAQAAWFRSVLADHRPVVAVERARADEPGSLLWACPVTDEAGKLIAVLSMVREVPWIGGLATAGIVPAGTTVLVIGGQGRIIDGGTAAFGSHAVAFATPALRSAAAAGREATLTEAGPDGIERIWGVAPIPVANDRPLMVAVGVSRDVVLAPVWRSLVNSLVLLALVSAAVLLIAWRGAKALVLRRVDALVGAARRLARGDASARGGIQYGRGELSELSVAFDQMAAALERRDADRRRAEEALRQSEQRFRTLTERGGDLVTLSTRDGVRIFVSASVSRVLGYQPDELLWNNVFDLVHPDDHERVRQQVREMEVQPGKGIPLLYRVRHQAGEWRWLEGTGTNLLEDPAVRANVANYRDVTTRIEAERQMRESEQKFRAIFDSALDALVVTDTTGTFVEANPAACELFGVSRDRLLGHRVSDFCSENTDFEQGWSEFLHRGRAKSEWRLVLGDGGARDVEYTGTTDFAPQRHLLVLRDVTERNGATRVLAEREQHFRALIEQSSDGIWLLDEHARITYASPSLDRLLGYEPHEFVGHELFQFLHSDGEERGRRRFCELMRESGGTIGVELRMQHRDGSWRWMECVASQMLDVPGVRAIVVNARDITEWIEAEDGLRVSEERFRQMAEHVPQVFWMMDIDSGALQYVSPAFEKLWGLSAESVLRNPESAIEAVHEDDRELVTTAMRDLREKRFPPDLEYRIIRPDGTMRWIWDRGFAIRDEAGRVVRMAGIAEDVTSRKQHEHALRTMSLVDELTGLYNRRGFLAFADQQILIADRTRNAIWLLFTDVDDLKEINDTFGHAEGDRALVEASRIMRDTFRESDVIARIGGDEFVVLAIETVKMGVEHLTARLDSRLKARNLKPGQRYPLGLSVGLAYFNPDHPESLEELLTRGDALMYEHKRSRRAA